MGWLIVLLFITIECAYKPTCFSTNRILFFIKKKAFFKFRFLFASVKVPLGKKNKKVYTDDLIFFKWNFFKEGERLFKKKKTKYQNDW